MTDPKTAPFITANSLNIGYHDETIVPDINFVLQKRQSLALIGTNGSGKSTLLKTLVGLIPPVSGKLNVLGQEPSQAARRMAYLSQFHASSFILPLRTYDVVSMGRYADRGLTGRLTSEDADLVMDSMKRMGVEKLANKPLRALSGGQQQRVYIAQALTRRADILVLDEPTSGLDAGAREVYQQMLLDELCRGASIVVATHDIQEAMDCTLTMLLARKVIAIGRGEKVITPEALLQTFGITITMGKKPGIAVVEREHGHDHPCDN
jgi:ABC-type Mn2+/Zn2+ transport system ATPase subunit